ncbi:hypothetical protein JXA02_10135 [candidate division KSB1 bacterium]|nr:hypothetical protein [candidate division KSB1 bacterium]RQW03712.1 MAG: hypothetical protein EH222_12155 [candidate division KSB1 bacterium]
MIKIIDSKISQDELKKICQSHFGTMVKFVVDIEKNIIALGGDMHADAESLLLQQGSRQSDLWGGALYPWNEAADRIDLTSFINIRPTDENMSMDVQNKSLRDEIRHLVESLTLGADESMEPLD